MEIIELILLLAAAVLASSIIDQLVPKVSAPLIQIGLGLLIAILAPSQIKIELDSEVFLVLFIAPLLFNEAKNADKAALWRNRGSIVSLAVGLVVVTTLVIGFAVHALIPSIPLAAAFALGAALGPTDAVSVASLSKNPGIPERQKSMLKGESLINDASGIVSFQFAIAAAVTGSFSLIDASLEFLVSFFGGILLGIVLGYGSNLLVRGVRSIGLENTTFHVLFEVLTPFIIFMLTEAMGVSGVLAVVAAGLMNVISPRGASGPSISRMNIVSTSVWRVLSFALNGVVFVLLGTQLINAMRSTWDDQTINNFALLGYILIIAFLLMFIRFLWVLGMDRIQNRRSADRHRLCAADLKLALITTLAGPKGTITLTVIFTIPVYLSTSPVVYFPQRELIIFLASGVILVTLLLATFVVPLLVPKQKREKNEQAQKETECSIEILRNVIEELTARQTSETRRATRTVIHSYNERIAHIKDAHGIEDELNVELRLQALQWEREYTESLMKEKEVLPVVGYQYLSRLDHIEQLLKHSTGRWSARRLYLRIRTFLRTVFHGIVRGLPGVSMPERTEALRELQVKSAEHVIGKLQEVIGESEDVPTEDASTLLLEYQRTCVSLRNTSPSITAITRTADKADDVRRLGLRLELEQIQTMYEEERLYRATAKRMRENVYLMQIDLEDTV